MKTKKKKPIKKTADDWNEAYFLYMQIPLNKRIDFLEWLKINFSLKKR